jgi:hypothetical protein
LLETVLRLQLRRLCQSYTPCVYARWQKESDRRPAPTCNCKATTLTGRKLVPVPGCCLVGSLWPAAAKTQRHTEYTPSAALVSSSRSPSVVGPMASAGSSSDNVPRRRHVLANDFAFFWYRVQHTWRIEKKAFIGRSRTRSACSSSSVKLVLYTSTQKLYSGGSKHIYTGVFQYRQC